MEEFLPENTPDHNLGGDKGMAGKTASDGGPKTWHGDW